MKRFLSLLCLLAMVVGGASSASATLNINVKLTGVETSTTLVGPDAINRAVAIVGDASSVNVQDAGTYTSVTLRSGKTYQIKGIVPGVIIQSASPTSPAVATSGTLLGKTDARLVNLTIVRTLAAASGATQAGAMVVNQYAGPTTVSLTNCIVRNADKVNSTSTTLGLHGGEGLVINGVTGGSSVGIIANLSTIESLTTGPGPSPSSTGGIPIYNAVSPTTGTITANGQNTQRHAITTAGTGTALTALTVKLTSCTVDSIGGQPINTGAANNQVWIVKNSVLKSHYLTGRRRGFNTGATHNNCVFSFTDTTISGPGELLFVGNDGTGNQWTINRCTIDGRRFGALRDPWTNQNTTGGTPGTAASNVVGRLRYNNIAGTNNQIQFINTLLIQHPGANAIENGGLQSQMSFYHCTIAKEEAATATANNGVSNQNSATGAQLSVFNTIFIGFSAGNALPGSIANTNRRGNMIVTRPTFADDVDAGPDRTTATLATLNLNANYVPQTGSPAIDTAYTSTPITAITNSKDLRNFLRPTFKTDKGAFETQSVPVELSSFHAE